MWNSDDYAKRIAKIKTGFDALQLSPAKQFVLIQMFNWLYFRFAEELADRSEFSVNTVSKLGYADGEKRRQAVRAYHFICDLKSKYEGMPLPPRINNNQFRDEWQKVQWSKIIENAKLSSNWLQNLYFLHRGEGQIKPNRDEWLKLCVKISSPELADSFERYKFIYGTAGKGSLKVKQLKKEARENPNIRIKGLNQLGFRAGYGAVFDPGVRAGAYLNENYQMMDMYYGLADNIIHENRVLAIGDFVHKAMQFKGSYDPTVSGRDAYMVTYDTTTEGWAWNSPRINGNTITVEMSRVIRWGVFNFKGTLIYEGKEVFYSQVFNKAGYKGDTDHEAIALLAYFGKGSSSAQFGNGTIIYYWDGKETVPTHCHFLSNWGFPPSLEGRMKAYFNETRETTRNTIRRVDRPKGYEEKPGFEQNFSKDDLDDAKKIGDIGSITHQESNQMTSIEDWINSVSYNIDFNEFLWKKFQEMPEDFKNVTVKDVLKKYEEGGINFIFPT